MSEIVKKEQDKSLKNYKIMLFMLTIVFVITLFINASLALFYNDSNILTNVNIGTLAITSQFVGDSSFDPEDLLSGQTIEKTFEITNPALSEDCYIRIRAVYEMDFGSGFEENGDVQMHPDATETLWDQGQTGGFPNAPTNYDGYEAIWYYYDAILTSDSTVQIELDFDVYPMAGEPYGINNDDSGNDFKITVYVDAIQTGTAYQTAWTGDYPVGWPS